LPLRSYLYAPGHRERILAKVLDAGADAVVLDLEDAVPRAEKQLAREAVRSFLLQRGEDAPSEIWVRINSLDGSDWENDLEAVVVAGVFGLRVPKSESRESLEQLDRKLSALEAECGLEEGTIRVSPAIESALGLAGLHDLTVAPRVVQITFGAADFTADIGADPGYPASTLWARSALVVACRAGGLAPPVVPVCTDLADEALLRQTTVEGKRLGFFGRSCIHPKQLATIHEVFTPSEEEVTSARTLLEGVDESRGGAVTTSGQFVDPAVLRHAKRTLELDRRLRGDVVRTAEGGVE